MTNSDNDTSLFGTEAHSEETLRMRQELINAGRAIRANDEAAFDTDLDTASAEVLATQLASQKDMGEAQLSYALHVLKENKAWIDHGFETFQDYVETKIQISAPKASALATRWENFIGVGLSSAALGGEQPVSWSKFGELVPGIKAGVIDDANIDMWLPLVASTGEHALTNKGISMLVKNDIAAAQVEEDPDQMQNLTVRLSADDKANVLNYINTLEQATGMLSAGEVIRMALEAKITEIAEDTEDVRKNYGLRRFKEMAERMVEGIQVIFLADPESGYSEDTIGVVPFTQVFQLQDDPTRFTLAASVEEAEEALGGAVTGYDISVASRAQEEFVVEEEAPEEVEAPEHMDEAELLSIVESIAGELANDFEEVQYESDGEMVTMGTDEEPLNPEDTEDEEEFDIDFDEDDSEPDHGHDSEDWGDVDEDDSVDYDAMDTSEIKTIVKDLMGELVDAGVITEEAVKEKCQELKKELLDTRETGIALCKFLNELAKQAEV